MKRQVKRTAQKITPFLWFDDRAEEAAKFYISIFKNSRLGNIARYGQDAAKASGQPAGSVMTVEFQAMLKMVKLDIRKLKQAARGE